MEYIAKEAVMTALDKLIKAREKCRNCSNRQTVEYSTLVYVKKILEMAPVTNIDEPEAQQKKRVQKKTVSE